VTASQRSEPTRPTGSTGSAQSTGPTNPAEPDPTARTADSAAGAVPPQAAARGDSDLLVALLDGMDAALCAFDAGGTITHWNREAERILGWSAAEAVGRSGLAGWALRASDAPEVEARLMGSVHAPGRRVDEFALLTKDGGRVLVRAQASGVPGADGRPAGLYCAFSEVHAQLDLERSIALSEALLDDASWCVVLVDADLRPAVVNANAADALRTGRTTSLGSPLGELFEQGVEDLEDALQHVLAEGAPPVPTDLWVTLRQPDRGVPYGPGVPPGHAGGAEPGGALGRVPGHGGSVPADDPAARRCLRSGFLRLSTPLSEEPAPLGVAWLFQDVTEARQQEQEGARQRFRSGQLYRAARAAAECEDPAEAAAVHLDFALAGFADHVLVDLAPADPAAEATGRMRLVRVAATPCGGPGPRPSIDPDGVPVAYLAGHPALQAAERCGSVRVSSARTDGPAAVRWAAARKWPDGTVYGLCSVLRSRGRTLGVATFLRGAGRRPFDGADAAYAEDIAVRVAAAIDLARQVR
jgi:PAS domain S-box-containing protein